MSSRSAKSSVNAPHSPAPIKRRLYGRKMTRPLGQERAQAFDALMPVIAISPEDIAISDKFFNPADFFKTSFEECWLEIGFGNGEHLAALMEKYPGVAMIGVEPFINGMAAFAKHIENKNIDHIRVFMDDARLLAAKLEDESLDRIYVLNPDPWPKKRHHKRRLIQQDTLSEFARILKPGGLLLMCTDVDALAEWMAIQACNHPDFTWNANNSQDWQNPPAGWASTTRYAEKGRKAGRRQSYLIYTRRNKS